VKRAALALLLATCPARAQNGPILRPIHDVDVTYKVPVPRADGTALLQRLRWSAHLRRLRLDLPTSGNWILLDLATHKLDYVRDAAARVIEQVAPLDAGLPGVPPGGTFSRVQDAKVAGLACTDFLTTDSQGGYTVACFTPDGILLRARTGGRVLLEALSVREAPQDPAIFEVPGGYAKLAPP